MKCEHSYVMDLGGTAVSISGKVVRLPGKGIYCVSCGYIPEPKETPQIFKDFSRLIINPISERKI